LGYAPRAKPTYELDSPVFKKDSEAGFSKEGSSKESDYISLFTSKQ
jgi:hypothetical protein